MNESCDASRNCLKVFCIAVAVLLPGCTTYVERPAPPSVYYPEPAPPARVYTPPPPPAYIPPAYEPQPPAPTDVVEVHSERDFDDPLRPYGRWEIVEPYGRCWVPTRVESDWRPYSNGSWTRTPAGWYWESNEPWGWATYHYGRWDFNSRIGWYWVPQTQWAPAWVEWRQGAGYVGWAPLHPSARVSGNGVVERRENPSPHRNYVFVEERKFLAPVRPATTVVNNTTIINNTVNISNVKVVNNTVINEGPRTTIIEKASGQKVQNVPVHELRRAHEAPVIAAQHVASRERENAVPNPVANDTRGRDSNARPPVERRADEVKVQSRPDAQLPAKVPDPQAIRIEMERQANEAKLKAQQDAQRIAKERDLKAAQLENARRTNEANVKADQEAQRIAKGQALRAAQLETERRANELKAQAQQEAQRIAKERDLKAVQLETERRASEAKAQAEQEAQRIAKGQALRAAQLETERRASEAKAQADQEAQRIAKGRDLRAAQLETERRAIEAKAGQSAQLPNGPVPDAAMVLRIQKALLQNPRYKQVTVLLSKGVLQLNGFIGTEEEKKQAGEFVKGVSGVKTLQNNISTKP